MIIRSQFTLRNGEVTPSLLAGVLAEHNRQAARYRRLKNYYMGDTEVMRRSRAVGLPNNKIAHPFARYIVMVAVGYLVGESVGYKTDAAQRKVLDRVLSAYKQADIAAVDIENARNASIFGKSVEFVTLPEDGDLPVPYALSPESAFVVYDDSIEHKPLFGVYLTRNIAENGETGCLRAVTATARRISQWVLTSEGWAPLNSRPHPFGRVPMLEYLNDENEKGDFEWVIPLIDAYDSLQSDRLNDKDQFADKLLVLTGCTLDTDSEGRPPWLQLRMDKALCLPDREASAQYLSGEMDESGNEILRKSLSEDIHKLSLVPDLTDTAIGGNVSGIAMRYRLLGLEQLAGMKQHWFTKGLKERLRLFDSYLKLRGEKGLDANRVTVTYTRTLPENLSETANVVKTAREAGAISTRTMVELLHKNGDWDEEMIEREANAARNERSESNGRK